MNTIRFFATIIILLGIGAVIYAVISSTNISANDNDIKKLIIYSVWGLIIFTSGIGLIRAVKNNP